MTKILGAPHKKVGEKTTTDDWNNLVYANWVTVGAIPYGHPSSTTLSDLDDSNVTKKLGAQVLVSSSKIEADVGSIDVTVSTIQHARSVIIEALGLLSDRAASVTDNLTIQFNDDTDTANYQALRVFENSSGLTAQAATSLGYFRALIPAANADTHCYGWARATIYNYASAVDYKQCIIESSIVGRSAGELYTQHSVGRWVSTDAIIKINLGLENGTNFLAGGTDEPQLIINLYALLGQDYG